MAEQQKKKYVDPNAFAAYGAAMAPVAGNPMAVEWQKAAEAQLASAEALLAKVQGAYKTDPLTLAVIGAVSQYVMEAVIGRADGCQKRCRTPGAAPCQRKTWNMALLAAFRKTKDEYVQTFLLDQLRWCGCRCRAKDVQALKSNAVSGNVKAYIDWTAAEVAGETVPAK